MSDSIDFYFDFSSPYGYLAAERIDEYRFKAWVHRRRGDRCCSVLYSRRSAGAPWSTSH